MTEEETPLELQSVEAFGESLLDDGRTEFTYEEADTLAEALGLSIAAPVIAALKGYGFTMAERLPEKRIRGFHTNNHDRFQACPMHGGSGWEQISGFGGQNG
jgi:hypothetical protein